MRAERALAEHALIHLTASEAAAEIARGAISAEDYARACLERIEALDGEIKAFTHLDRDHALSQARALDERRAQGQPIGPLHGVPVAIKDIIDTADYPTELGSPLAAGRRPWKDATAVAKLRAAGAVIIGKSVTTGRRAIRMITRARPAARRRDRQRRSPRIWSRSRSAARPTDR